MEKIKFGFVFVVGASVLFWVLIINKAVDYMEYRASLVADEVVEVDNDYTVYPPMSAFLPEDQIDCLTRNAYHEARGEGVLGMAIVTRVVANRAKSNNFSGYDFCGVIFHKAQFSWTLKKELVDKEIPHDEYLRIRTLVKDVIDGTFEIPKQFQEADHYTRVDVNRKWMHSLKYVGEYGKHKFFKIPV